MDSSYWNEKYDTEEFVYTTTVNRFVKEYLEALPAGKMIDLAGGEGRNAVWFAEHGWQVEVVDFADKALAKFLKFAQERGVADLTTATVADATGFEAQLSPADLGVIGYLQIAKEPLAAAISGLVSQLRSGATFFGVWHALDNLEGGFGGPRDPEVLPSVASLTEILGALPLNVETIAIRDGQIQTRDGLKPSKTVIAKALVN
ncbi:MAG: class I SAM-dependent methyltransferase [Actinomycetes bacterium]